MQEQIHLGRKVENAHSPSISGLRDIESFRVVTSGQSREDLRPPAKMCQTSQAREALALRVGIKKTEQRSIFGLWRVLFAFRCFIASRCVGPSTWGSRTTQMTERKPGCICLGSCLHSSIGRWCRGLSWHHSTSFRSSPKKNWDKPSFSTTVDAVGPGVASLASVQRASETTLS